MKYKFLSWDSNFFGFNTSSVRIADPIDENIEDIIEKEYSSGTKLLYVFSIKPISNNDLINKYNGLLVDKKVVFKKSLFNFHTLSTHEIEEYKDNFVNEALMDLVFQSGEFSRFKIDNRLPAQSFEKLYTNWIENSVNGNSTDKVFIFKVNNEIAGFITIVLKEKFDEIALIAVNSKFRGMGIGSRLIQYTENYVLSQKTNTIKVATQLDNILACKFYEKNGYEIDSITHVYHFINQ